MSENFKQMLAESGFMQNWNKRKSDKNLNA